MPNNDSHQHVVKTSAQWNDRAVEYWIVPRGCLCVELTSRGKTKLKVGEGNKYYAQLPYICDIEDLSEYYTKEEINNLFNNLNRMAIMSTEEYDEKSDLPLTGNKLGDVRFVKSSSPSLKLDPDVYLWNGHKWIFVGYDIIDIDLSQYIKREEFEPVAAKVDEMYPKMHTHENKETLDRIEEPYTTAEKDKLNSLENYDDTEIRALIRQTTHVHPNKRILDQIQQPFKNADKTKLDSLENYDDTELRDRISDVEAVAHTHSNKDELDLIYSGFVDEHQVLVEFKNVAEEEIDDLNNDVADLKTKIHSHSNKNILDSTTAPYTTQDKATLDELASITIFDGASPTYDGFRGYVPAPVAGQESYFLRGDGTWAKIKQDGDKYKAGDGIYILAGDASSTTLPVEIYAKANKLKQYILYGGENPVGDWDSTLNKYAVVIKVSAEGMSDISTSLLLDDPIGNGDYIDYENQQFVHTRTNITFSVRDGEWGEWVNVNGVVENNHQDRMAPSDYIAVSSEYVYLYYPGDMHGCDQFGIPCYAALYDENKVFIRSILLRSFTEVMIEPQPGEVYMRVSYGYYQDSTYRLTQIGEVITPIILPPVIIYTNKVNTIDVMTTNKPTEVYFETSIVEDASEDPMSEYTGIIYNDGVLDITQDDPNALNELTIHFRESDKVLTIPSGDGRTYYPGQGIEFGGETLEETSFRMSDFIRNLSGRNCTLFKNDILTQIRLTATDYDAYTIPYIGQVSGVDSYTFTAEPNTKYRLTWESNAPNVHGRVFVFENQNTTNMYSVDQATASSLTFTTSSTCNVLTFRVGVQNTGDIVTYSNIQLFKVIPNNNVINAKIGIGLTFDSNNAIELDDSIKLRLNCNNDLN